MVLAKVKKEDNVDEQPLYIDDDNIKCHWCSDHFKGSVLAKHLNQHVKNSRSHIRARRRMLGNEGDDHGCQDIRNFFT